MLAVAAVALILYGRSLNFAFFNDDPTGHFAWMKPRTFLNFFAGSAEYGYYRPIVFVLLKSLVNLIDYQPAPFHALLLILNAANTALLWLLTYRLSQNRAYAWAVALIFVTVPFSYEAVAYVASLTHPLLLFWLLLTLLLYCEARKRASIVWYAAAYVTMVLGLFSHENGLFIPLALVGVDWLMYAPQNWRDGVKRPFLPFFIAPVLYFLLWLSIPKTGQQTLPTLAQVGRNLIPFMQTLVYPLLPLFNLDVTDQAALVLLSLLVLIVTFAAAWLARAVRLWLFGLAWFILSALPAVLFLNSAYLYGSPRLSYLPAVGAALLLGLPVLALSRCVREPVWARIVSMLLQVIYVAAVVLPPLAFIRCELDFYAQATRIVYQMRAAAQSAPEEQDILFVNVPFFFSSFPERPQGCENPYPWTPVGAVVMPSYARAADFVRFNNGPARPATAVSVPEYAPGWQTFGPEMALSDMRMQLNESAVYVYDLTRDEFFDLSATWRPGAGAAVDVLATFGNGLQLVDTAVSQTDDQIKVTLTWQAGAVPLEPLTAFVHLYAADGSLVAQHDGPLLQNMAPAAFWQPQDILMDAHTITLQNPLASGSYTLAAGLYNPISGERVTAVSNTAPLPDDLIVIAQLERP